MNIIVCIKQVPGTAQVEIDEKTGVLKRDGVASKMNPFDLFAIESAMRLKEKYGGRVTALTMGPPQAEKVLREAFMMGVDDAVLLSDRRFGGADVLATSYTISQGILMAAETKKGCRTRGTGVQRATRYSNNPRDYSISGGQFHSKSTF